MKKIIVLILIAAFLMISLSCTTIAANSPGSAPSSGDGVLEGIGLDNELVGNGNRPGPAPNFGDGVSDGPGWN